MAIAAFTRQSDHVDVIPSQHVSYVCCIWETNTSQASQGIWAAEGPPRGQPPAAGPPLPASIWRLASGAAAAARPTAKVPPPSVLEPLPAVQLEVLPPVVPPTACRRCEDAFASRCADCTCCLPADCACCLLAIGEGADILLATARLWILALRCAAGCPHSRSGGSMDDATLSRPLPVSIINHSCCSALHASVPPAAA